LLSPKAKRIFAWSMALLMALMVLVPSLSAMVDAADDEDEYEEELVAEGSEDAAQPDFTEEKNQISNLNNKYKQLQQQQNEIQSKITAAQGQRKQQEALKQEIDNQINNTLQQIDLLNERIALLEDEIRTKEKEMNQKQAEIDDTYELFKLRFRAMTATQNTSTLGLVLGAEDFSEFLTRTEVSTRIAKYDQAMMDALLAEKRELEEIKGKIEESKAGVERDKADMAVKKNDLDHQMSEAQERIQDIAAMEREFLANKAELQKQMAAVQAEIDKIYDEINKNSANSVYSGGQMAWPAPGLSMVTSEYGSRFGGSDYHTGIDISGGGAYGASIVAANSGTVAFVNTAVTPGYGYGKYLIIDHGGGISTLYAHCSAINVSVGEKVSRGQKIAEVGSTGWSTGPHVHFEVRVNGKHQPPRPYLGR